MAFSNDLYPIVGQTRIRGLWAALGVWVTHSGGVGKAIAELMTTGECEWDLREADINRFHPHDYTKRYMRARIDRQYQEVYDVIHPLQQMEKPRNLRLAPFHARLVEQGGVCFASAGWEVPQWYEANAHLLEEYDDQIPQREGWAARYWSRIQGAEHLATRAHAGLFNLSTFTKIEVSGPGALGFLESITANRIDRPVGTVIYTALCNSRGGIMADLTVSRLEDDRFWILTGGGVGPHDLAWIRQHTPTSSAVDIRDMSGQYTTLGLWGPRARDILQQLCEEDVSDAAFPFYTVKPLHIDCVPALALRLSYAGELGWEIYAPIEYGLRLWDLLWEAGRPHGMVMGGAGAFDSLRLEKGYRLWGSDIYSEYNPFEAGLGWAVRLNKGYFLGPRCAARGKAARQAQAVLHDVRRSGCHGSRQRTDSGRRQGCGLRDKRQLWLQRGQAYSLWLPSERICQARNASGRAVFWQALLRHRHGRAAVRPHQQPHEGVGGARRHAGRRTG